MSRWTALRSCVAGQTRTLSRQDSISQTATVCVCVWRVGGLTSVMLALLVYHYDRHKWFLPVGSIPGRQVVTCLVRDVLFSYSWLAPGREKALPIRRTRGHSLGTTSTRGNRCSCSRVRGHKIKILRWYLVNRWHLPDRVAGRLFEPLPLVERSSQADHDRVECLFKTSAALTTSAEHSVEQCMHAADPPVFSGERAQQMSV